MNELTGRSSKSIAFLYLKTGGGHEAPARSVAAYLSSKYPTTCRPMLFNCLENGPRYICGVVEDGYRLAQQKAKWVYSALYEMNKFKPVLYSTAAIVGRAIKDYVYEVVLPSNPDKIVVFHFFIIKPVMELIEELGLDIKVEVVVTDPFTAHPFWFICKGPSYVLFSERLKEQALKAKWLTEDKVKVFPFVVNARFDSVMGEDEKNIMKWSLKLNQSKKTVLLLGGGDGMPGAMGILKSMVDLRLDANVIVVCGRNEAQRDALLYQCLDDQFASLTILGFVDYVYELINISDVVVTKCGPNAIMEILMCGKVPIVNSYIWEQEKGNLEFVLSNEVGIYEKSPSKISQAVLKLINDEETLVGYKERIKKLSISNGTALVSEHIYE